MVCIPCKQEPAKRVTRAGYARPEGAPTFRGVTWAASNGSWRAQAWDGNKASHPMLCTFGFSGVFCAGQKDHDFSLFPSVGSTWLVASSPSHYCELASACMVAMMRVLQEGFEFISKEYAEA